VRPAPREEAAVDPAPTRSALTRRDIERVLDIVKDLSRLRDLDGVMAVVRRAARELSGADGVTFVLREGDLAHYADEDAIAPLWKGRRFPVSACVSGWAMTHRRTVVIEDIYADPRVPVDAYRPTFVTGLAVVPIRAEDPLGAIGAYWAGPHLATPREVELLEALAAAAAVAVDNARLYQELAAAVRARDEFLLRAAHELRTPLTAVHGTVKLLQRVFGGELPESPEALTDVAARNLDTLRALLNSLLDASKLQAGAERLDAEPVDLADLVRCSLEVVGPQARDKGVALRSEVEGPLALTGDPLKLEQVLINLLANATRSTPRGGEVVVEAAREAQEVVVRVRDSGQGIRPEHLERIFEPFFRVDCPGERRKAGAGLGLAICRQIVRLHGGRVWAESEGPGKGATFVVALPRAPGRSVAA